MISRQFLIFLILFQVIEVELANEKSFTKGHRYRAVTCKEPDKSVGYFDVCYLKAYSRTFVSLNINFVIVDKLEKPINVYSDLQYRYGNIYRSVVKMGPIEWCSLAETAITNPIVKNVLAMNQKIKALIIKCPVKNQVRVTNLTVSGGQLPFYPSGFYRNDMKLCVSNKTFEVRIDYEIKSDIKTSFK